MRFKKLLLIAVPLLVLAIPLAVTVKLHSVGRVTYCTAGEVIKKDIHKAIVFSLRKPADDVVTVNETCARHREVYDLYDRATEAAASGDKEKAEQLLSKLQSLDSDFDVSEVRERIGALTTSAATAAAAGSSASSRTSRSGTTEGASPTQSVSHEPPVSANANLLSYLPASVTGYSKQGSEKLSRSAFISFTAPKGPAKGFSATVRWYPKAADAARFLDVVHKRLYSHGRRPLKVKSFPGAFGTDNRNYACLAWARSNLSFEILLTANTNDMALLLAESQKISNNFRGN